MTNPETHAQLVNARNWLDQHDWLKGSMFKWSRFLDDEGGNGGKWGGACARGALVLANCDVSQEPPGAFPLHTHFEEGELAPAIKVLAKVIQEWHPCFYEHTVREWSEGSEGSSLEVRGVLWPDFDSDTQARILVASYNDTRASKKYVIALFDEAIRRTAPAPQEFDLKAGLDTAEAELVGC